MRNEHVQFHGAVDASLRGILSAPDDGRVLGCAVFAHCFTCSKDLKAVVNISRALVDRGIAVFRFDFTGLGESEGDFGDTDFSSNVADLVTAAEYLESRVEAPRLLVGHSLGGAAVLHAALRLPSVRAVSTIGAPSDPEHVTLNFSPALPEILETGHAEVTLAGRTFTVTREFVEDLQAQNMERCVRELRRALLIFHSPVDATVGIENAAKIYEAARHPKSFVSLDGADHLLMEPDDARFVGEVLGAWAGRYLL